MNENDVVEILCDFINTQFPKNCKRCGKHFTSLADYLRNTTHRGKPISYDVDKGNWRPIKQIGTLSMANCSCGSTLAISSINMELRTLWKLMIWARKEIKIRDTDIREILEELRNKIDIKVLQDEN